jgi:hypothetical protein
VTSRSLTASKMLVPQKKSGSIATTPAATSAQLDQYEAMILGSFKVPSDNTIADAAAFVTSQRLALERKGYSWDVIVKAYDRVLAREEWMPATATVLKECRKIVDDIKEREREVALEKEERELRERSIENEALRRRTDIDGVRRIFKKFGKQITLKEIEDGYNAINKLIGGEISIWIHDVYRNQWWTVDACKYMASVYPRITNDMDEQEKEQIWMEYFAMRRNGAL